ncbi:MULTISPECIES: hypothetical protein [Nocardia]|uniref:hypothetical protein n=1 Tax=Nocardia TaxID=1817 RepID=UPI0007A4CE98|nr:MULTISPECIES: hypothetical protein [Nocardia]MBF6276401.1 hypothetical protein [Nocardia nova]OBA45995.1 hypothetical protein A5789_05780 [Nocardia sp. 852002-51101_SCH5132738]OBB38580.1 hypothetical protein A5748_02685 [Nocardia sp. 852002-51244_SCH5132740]OBF82944.1 hypothetical protein A9X06_18440 [Mycobacterium sp. 852002-51759_SCH5129042]
MSEKVQNPQHSSGETTLPAEQNHDREQLVWDVGETLLRVIYDAARHPSLDARAAAAAVALQQVQRTHEFDVAEEDGLHELAAKAGYIFARLVELIDAYDELTTSDLQGAVEALTLRLVQRQLPTGTIEQLEGGDHE